MTGDEEGRFTVVLDSSILESPLLGDGMDQKAGWGEVLKETFDAAAGELLAKAGKKCRVESFEEAACGEQGYPHAFNSKSGERTWTILVRDESEGGTALRRIRQIPATPPSAAEPSSMA